MNDALRLAIEAALEMAESFIAAAHHPAVHPMPKRLRDQVWSDFENELERAELGSDEALRLYAEERSWSRKEDES